MKPYKTLNEVKKELPEILERIKNLKLYIEIDNMFMSYNEGMAILKLYDDKPITWFESQKCYNESYKSKMRNMAEINYLQGLINKIQLCPQI